VRPSQMTEQQAAQSRAHRPCSNVDPPGYPTAQAIPNGAAPAPPQMPRSAKSSNPHSSTLDPAGSFFGDFRTLASVRNSSRKRNDRFGAKRAKKQTLFWRPSVVHCHALQACSSLGSPVPKAMQKISYSGYRFPPEIIQQAVWLYLRFTLSFRDVEDLLAERGITVSYETVRRWVSHFGPIIAADLRKRRPRPDTIWHLDEVYLKIAGRMVYLWRAVDAEGEVLDVLVQSKRN
jgi:DDE domain